MPQQFEISKLLIPGVLLIVPFSSFDDRGGMVKDYSKDFFEKNEIVFEPVETMYIQSRKDVLRGLHFQKVKKQSKLVRCISGFVWSVVVDLRLDSPTLGKWISLELNQENRNEVFVPGDCAFGTLALEDSLISCKCGEKYYAEYDTGIIWNDADLAVKWPFDSLNHAPIISSKDRSLQSYKDYLKTV